MIHPQIQNTDCLPVNASEPPPFTGPSSVSEAMSRIDEAERQEEQGDTFSLEEVMSEARKLIEVYEHTHH